MHASMERELTEEQKAKAADRRKAFAAVWQQVALMSDAQRINIAARFGLRTVEDKQLSIPNTILVYLQQPTACVVGGFRQWLKHGRAVRKGEHGAAIWVPIFKPVDGSIHPAERCSELESAEAMETRFIIGTVFDISQTNEIETEQVVANQEQAIELA